MTSTALGSKGARGPKTSRTPGISSRVQTRAATRKASTPKVSYSCQQTNTLPNQTQNESNPQRTLSIYDQHAGLYEPTASTTISMRSEPPAIDPALGNPTYGTRLAESWQQYDMETFATGTHFEQVPRSSYHIDEESSLGIDARILYPEPYNLNNMVPLPCMDTSVPDIFSTQHYPLENSPVYGETPAVYIHSELQPSQVFQQPTSFDEQINFNFNQMGPSGLYDETIPDIAIKDPSSEPSQEGDGQIDDDDDQTQTCEAKYEPSLSEEKMGKVSEEGSNSKGKSEAVVFACPFFRLDHIRYMSCLNLKMTRIRDVKQHLQRRHYHVPIYCKRCHIEFCSSAMLYEHINRKSCKPRAEPVALHLKGVSRAAQQQLKYPMHRTMPLNEQWFKIWNILFPKEPRPSNPYLGTFLKETMDMIENFWVQKGDAVTRKVIKENPSVCKNGNDVHLIMAALLKEVRLQQEQPTQNIASSGNLDPAYNSGQ